MHIVTWNAQGGGRNEGQKKALLHEWYNQNIDVVCIQEAGRLPLSDTGWVVNNAPALGAFNQRCKSGILYRRGEPLHSNSCTSSTGRSICGVLIDNTAILSIHAESSVASKQDFLNSMNGIKGALNDNRVDRIVIGGDFNHPMSSFFGKPTPFRKISEDSKHRYRACRNDNYEVRTQYWRTHQSGKVLDYFITEGTFSHESVFIPWKEFHWGLSWLGLGFTKKYSDHNPVHFTFT